MSTKEIQEALEAAGFNPGPIDGVMGPLTRAAIRKFQESSGLTVDGIVGTDTSLALASGGAQTAEVDDRNLGAEGQVTFEDVQALFDGFNLTAATSRESSSVRIQRITDQINAGDTTLEKVSKTLSGFASDTVTSETIAAIFEDLGLTADAARFERIADEVNAGTRDLANVRSSLLPFAKITPGTDTTAAPGVDVDPATDPVLSDPEANIPGVIGGGDLIQVERKDQDDLFFLKFAFPPGSNQFVLYQFESLEQVKSALGEDVLISGVIPFSRALESILEDTNFTVVGSASELIGQSGDFNDMIADVTATVARRAGITDPTMLSKYLADPEIQAILTKKAIAGDLMSDAEVTAAIRQTVFYQNTLYPGITNFFGRSDAPEVLWKQYTKNVTDSLIDLGVERDADGSFRTSIGALLSAGIEDKSFVEFAPVFVRASQSPVFADALNQWTEQELGTSVTFEDVFNVLGGTTDAELSLIVEKAGIQFQAERAGVDLSSRLISTLARTTNLSEAQIAANFSSSEQRLLALGDSGLLRSGLTQDALIQSAFGNVAVIDGVELSATDISARASKFAIELGLEDDPKAQLFVGFSDLGAPTRPGLLSLSPEGA